MANYEYNHGDGEYDMLRKILQCLTQASPDIAGAYRRGDSWSVMLHKVVSFLSGEAIRGESDQMMLGRWLRLIAPGAYTRGDSEVVLWRKILKAYVG